eukprot:314268_1
MAQEQKQEEKVNPIGIEEGIYRIQSTDCWKYIHRDKGKISVANDDKYATDCQQFEIKQYKDTKLCTVKCVGSDQYWACIAPRNVLMPMDKGSTFEFKNTFKNIYRIHFGDDISKVLTINVDVIAAKKKEDLVGTQKWILSKKIN